MKFVLNVPMLAHHRDEGSGRAHQTGNVEAVVTGDGRLLVRHANRFDANHRLEIRPFPQFRKGREVRYSPDTSPHGAAMRVIAGVTEILAGAPGQVMFDVLMEVLFDSFIDLFVIAF